MLRFDALNGCSAAPHYNIPESLGTGVYYLSASKLWVGENIET